MGTPYHLLFLKKTLYIVSVPLTWEVNIKNITFRNHSMLISSKLYNNKKLLKPPLKFADSIQKIKTSQAVPQTRIKWYSPKLIK